MTKKICEVCEEESTCDFVKDYDHEVCCRCDRSVEINKNCFNYAEQLMLQKCFKIKWDLNWNIHRKGKYYRLYLKHRDIPRFFDIINKTVDLIPSMKYKTSTKHNFKS